MIRKLLIILFAFSFLAQSSFRLFYYLDYSLHKEKYVVNCINKANTKMKCEGKCQLSKKIVEDDNKNKQHNSSFEIAYQLAMPEPVITYESLSTLSLDVVKKYYHSRSIGLLQDYNKAMLRPPIAA